MRFSQRQGITPSEKPVQLDFIDEDLLNSLWNIYKLCILDNLKNDKSYRLNIIPFKQYAISLWHNFYKLPIDAIPYQDYETKESIRKWFFQAEWFEIYDFIEFSLKIVSQHEYQIQTDLIETKFNNVLERDFSGYRFIRGAVSQITNEQEIAEINNALAQTKSFTALNGCNIHLHAALTKLSDRKNPDYRNSIKESISAVESIAKKISKNAKDSLGASLDKIKGKINIHPALEKGFKQIYGYTSDGDGIRHALTDETSNFFCSCTYCKMLNTIHDVRNM